MSPTDGNLSVEPRGVAKWFDRGFWALCDQALFAGSNFAINVALARWLTDEDYGEFASAYAVFLLLGVFHTALLSEPMLVFGPGKFRGHLRGYWAKLMRGHLVFAVAAAVVLAGLGGAGLLAGQPTLGAALLTLAVTQTFMYLPWMLRNACYVLSDPRSSAIGGLWYLAAVMLGLAALNYSSTLNINTALMVMGGAAAVACLHIVRALRIPLQLTSDAPPAVAAEHWHYGRWAIATGLTHYVPQNLPLLMVPAILGAAYGAEAGYAAGGAVKALLNLTVPFILAGWALSNLIVPLLVTRRGTAAFGRLAWGVGAALVLLAIVVWLPVAGFGRTVLDLIYKGHFNDHAPLLWIIGVIPLMTGPTIVMSAALRAIERPERIFYGALAAAVVIVAAGVPMLSMWGLTGMVWAMAASHVAMLVVMAWCGRRVLAEACGRGGDDDAAAAALGLQPMAIPALSAQPLVSVLVGNRNYAAYVGEAIQSVLDQTYPHFELIVCDDGSTDESVAVIESYARRDPRVQMVVKCNGGQASALNEAYRHARGEVVCLLDADDRFAPDKLEKVVQQFRAEPAAGLLVHALHVVDATGRAIQRIPFLSAFERGWLASRVIRRGGRWRYMPTSALALRRTLADTLFPIPEPELRTSADSFLFTAAPLLAEVGCIREVLGDYRLHDRNSYSVQQLDASACARSRDAIAHQIDVANRWFESRSMDVRLDRNRNLNHLEYRFFTAVLEGTPGGAWTDALHVLGRVLTDDLYRMQQKLLALPLYGVVVLLPPRWRAGWLNLALSYGPHKRWVTPRSRTRPRPAPAQPVAITPLASPQEALG